MKHSLLIVLLSVGMLGCAGHPERRHIVVLIDISGSIDRVALRQAFKAIDGLVGSLRRGDKVAIVPILADAQAETPGRVIRFDVPTDRQPYDADLRNFRVKLETTLREMESDAVAHPESKTDILGSVAVAGQEFQSRPGDSKRILVILSDFIQEDSEIDFRTDKRLATTMLAQRFVRQISKNTGVSFKGTQAYLGHLRSREYMHLSRNRREALVSFWTEYFAASGAPSKFVTDGPGLLQTFEDSTN